MVCGQRISPRACTFAHAAPNHDSQKLPDLLILHQIISRRINTYGTPKKSRISLIPLALKSPRINTSGAKDLKSIRINTSGNKDLKSFRINTSKNTPGGAGSAIRASLSRPFCLTWPEEIPGELTLKFVDWNATANPDEERSDYGSEPRGTARTTPAEKQKELAESKALGGVRGLPLRLERCSFRPRPTDGETISTAGCADLVQTFPNKSAGDCWRLPAVLRFCYPTCELPDVNRSTPATIQRAKQRTVYSALRKRSSKSRSGAIVLHHETGSQTISSLMHVLSTSCGHSDNHSTFTLGIFLLACYTLRNEFRARLQAFAPSCRNQSGHVDRT
jgi:hypothetical protein